MAARSRQPIALSLAAALGVLIASSASGEAGASASRGADAAKHYLRYLPADPLPLGGANPGEEASDALPADRLQTAVVRFRSGADLVDLVAVVHLGDAEYFALLDERLAGYDRVLYEMVGGGIAERGADPAPVAPGAGADPLLGAVGTLQQGAKQWLGLEFQLDAIDYRRPHFVHADLTWEEYRRLSADSGQGIATLFERMLALSGDEGFSADFGLPTSDLGSLLMMTRIAAAVSQGDGAGLKRLLGPILANSGAWLERLEGEDGTLIVGERNRIAMGRLAEERTRRPGGGHYAIFYGAGHMPDLEARLVAEGFVAEGVEWIDAWIVPHSPPTKAESAASELLDSPADAAQRFLDSNPGILDAVRELGNALQRLQEAGR
jgi:hypothetical protein